MDCSQIVERFKKRQGFQTDLEAGEFFGDKPKNFNGKKRRGTIAYPILEWAVSNKEDLNSLFYGTDPEKLGDEMPEDVYRRLYDLKDELSKLKDENQALKEDVRQMRDEIRNLKKESAKGHHPRVGAEAKEPAER